MQNETKMRFQSLLAVAMFLPGWLCAFDLDVNSSGIQIKAGSIGELSISAPVLTVNGKEEESIEKKASGNQSNFRYPCGATLQINRDRDEISMAFAKVPKGSEYKISMLIPGNYKDGAKWAVDGIEKEFPQNLVKGKPHLYQGNNGIFTLISFDNRKLIFKLPASYAYQQLTDNREWNWNVFAWFFTLHVEGNETHKLVISCDETQVKTVRKMDRFGQAPEKKIPEKISSEAELRNDAKTENSYYQSLPESIGDAFGGQPGSRERLGLQKTGFFHVEKKAGRWYMVDPAGNAFFQLGICSFNFMEDYTWVQGRESIYEWIPPHDAAFHVTWNPEPWWNDKAVSFYLANLIRKYGIFDKDQWTERMIQRVRAFGFNSIGAFTEFSPVYEKTGFPYVAHLPLSLPEIPGLRGIFDPFHTENAQKIDRAFSKSIAENAGKTLLIGYFLANEQEWEHLPRAVSALNGSFAAKRELVKMLREKYPSIAAFNKARDLKASNFTELLDRGLPITTREASADMLKYNELFLETYYKLIADTFHKYDKNHLLIGNRWQPGTADSEVLCKVAGKYMDVISINYYTTGIDENFVNRLYKWSGEKPQIWSEFFYTSEKESNVNGRGMDVSTQKERGMAYRQYVEQGAALGFVVGIEWFTLTDQSATGRFFEKYNGECYNTGLFSVTDRPYKDMIAEMVTTHQNIYNICDGKQKPFVFNHPSFTIIRKKR